MKSYWLIAAILSFMLLPACAQSQMNQAVNCQDSLASLEKAISAFVTDSTRKSAFFFKTVRTAEGILRNCQLDAQTKRIVSMKKDMIDFYANYLLDYQEFKFLKNPSEKKLFFESKVESLNKIDDPSVLPFLNYLKGIYYSRISINYPLAISFYKKAINDQTNWNTAMNELAWTYILSRKYDSAKFRAADCIKINPGYAPGYVTLGYTYGYAKNIDKAFACFQKALSINPILRSAYMAKGWWYENLKLTDSSINYYHNAIQADSLYTTAYFSLAKIFKQRHEYDSAELYYNKCLAINPYMPDVYIDMGDIFKDKYDKKKLAEMYKRAVALDSFYLYTLGILDHNNGNYEQAIKTYERALLYNNDKWTNRNIGVCYYQLKKYPESISYLEKSLELDSSYANPHEWLASIYSIYMNTFPGDKQNKQKAIYHLQKAFSMLPDTYNAAKYYSFLAFDTLKTKDTLAAFNLFYEGGNNGCDTCLNYAHALMYEHGYNGVERDFEKAEELYSKALWKNNSDFAWNELLYLYESGKIAADFDNWEKNNSGYSEKIVIPCVNEKGDIEQDSITLYEYYPEGIHPLLLEALRMKKKNNTTFSREQRNDFQSWYSYAQRYGLSFPYWCKYNLTTKKEQEYQTKFDNFINLINTEKDKEKKLALSDELIKWADKLFKENSYNRNAVTITSKAHQQYGELLEQAGKTEEGSAQLKMAISLDTTNSSAITYSATINFRKNSENAELLMANSTKEEWLIFLSLFFEKDNKKNADIIAHKIVSGKFGAKLKYEAYKVYLQNGYDMFSEWLFSDTDPNNLRNYRSYFLQSAGSKTSYADKVIEYEKLIKLDEVLQKSSPDKNLSFDIASDYNNYGWYALLSKDFTKAKMAINRGLDLDKTNVYLKGNLPHVLLFTGKTEKAIEEYLRLKDLPFGDWTVTGFKKFRDAFLDDFKSFETENIFHPEIENIKKLLKIK